MFDFLRKAMISQKVNEVKGEMLRAGQALQELLEDPALLDKLDAQTIWSVLHGMEASFTVLETALRSTLSENEEIHADVRRSLREVQAAVATLRGSMASVTPFVETLYPQPPKKTQWKLVPPGTQD